MSNTTIFKMRDGNMMIGIVEDRTPDMGWLCSSIAVIRRWGTTEGYLQLCGGPTNETVVDGAVQMPAGTLAEIPRGNVIAATPCMDEPWAEILTRRK